MSALVQFPGWGTKVEVLMQAREKQGLATKTQKQSHRPDPFDGDRWRQQAETDAAGRTRNGDCGGTRQREDIKGLLRPTGVVVSPRQQDQSGKLNLPPRLLKCREACSDRDKLVVFRAGSRGRWEQRANVSHRTDLKSEEPSEGDGERPSEVVEVTGHSTVEGDTSTRN